MTTQKKKFLKNFFEKNAWAEGLYTCGIDEVGRGCLAGPVVVGAAIIPQNASYHLLRDSKLMSEEERLQAFKWINKNCHWSIGIAGHRIVDERNIYQATLYAMRKAYLQLIETLPFPLEKLKYVLIDAMPLSFDQTHGHKGLEFHHFNYGERLSTSIAAASIVAKVTRDRIMEELDPRFPGFAFGQHKGYATKQHIAALLEQGPSIIHRISFIDEIQKRDKKNTHDNGQQESLF